MAIRGGIRVADVVQSCFDISAYTLAEAYSTIYQAQRVNPTECLPDAQLLTTFGPARAVAATIAVAKDGDGYDYSDRSPRSF